MKHRHIAIYSRYDFFLSFLSFRKIQTSKRALRALNEKSASQCSKNEWAETYRLIWRPKVGGKWPAVLKLGSHFTCMYKYFSFSLSHNTRICFLAFGPRWSSFMFTLWFIRSFRRISLLLPFVPHHSSSFPLQTNRYLLRCRETSWRAYMMHSRCTSMSRHLRHRIYKILIDVFNLGRTNCI